MGCFEDEKPFSSASLRANRYTHRILLAILSIFIVIAIVLFVSLYASASFAEINFLGRFRSTQPLGIYPKAAVATDAPGCARYGRELLERNGTAMDALISVLLCMGVVIPESMGLGGGLFIVHYKREDRQAWVINGRETAPGDVTEDMYKNHPKESSQGAKSIGIPGELAAYWEAHKKFGNLKWSELFEGAIDISTRGFPMHSHLYEAFLGSQYNRNDSDVGKLFINPETGKPYELNEIMKRPDLADTFKRLAATDVSEFYSGSMGHTLVQEIRSAGGIITEKDFDSYQADTYEAMNLSLPGDYTLFSVDPPGSGHLLAFILNVFLSLDKMDNQIASSLEDSAIYYHRFVEVFKHAYAQRGKLEDRKFGRIEGVLKKLSSPEFRASIAQKINDKRTYQPSYYDPQITVTKDHGTSHVSVVDKHGNAAAASSTINVYFGSGVVSPSTGIIFNDEMDDFSSANITNSYGLAPSQMNHIEPGKRPFSSMCPSIIVDNRSGKVKMVIGASGGAQITTSVALTIARSLYLGETIKESIDAPRLHHQFSPNHVKYESSFPQNILSELRDRGHETQVITGRSSVVMAILRDDQGRLTANSDYRKGGSIDGY